MAHLPAARLVLELDVLLEVEEVPRDVRDLVETDDRAVLRVNGAAVFALHDEARDVLEALACVEGVNHVAEGELSLSEGDSVSDTFSDVGFRHDAREPATPDDREVGEALADSARHAGTVGDLEAEDA